MLNLRWTQAVTQCNARFLPSRRERIKGRGSIQRTADTHSHDTIRSPLPHPPPPPPQWGEEKSRILPPVIDPFCPLPRRERVRVRGSGQKNISPITPPS